MKEIHLRTQQKFFSFLLVQKFLWEKDPKHGLLNVINADLNSQALCTK